MKRTIVSLLLIWTATTVCAGDKNTPYGDTVRIDRVIVTDRRPVHPSASVSVVTRPMIEQSGENSLLSLLPAYVPGLFVTERGTMGYGVYSGSAGAISMRGVGASPTTQVLITVDGLPQVMGINGHHLPDAFRASDAERIEVVRGPASTVYGSNAMGGVINIVTREPQQGVRTNLDASYGSYNTQHYMGSNSVRASKFTSFVSVNHDRTDGHRKFSDFRLTGGDLKLGYELSEHLRVTGNFSFAKYRSTDPGPIQKPAVNDTLTADVLRIMSAVSLENSCEKTRGALRLYYNYGDHDLYYGWQSQDRVLGAMFYQSANLFQGNTLTAGVDVRRYGGTASDRSKPAFGLDKYINETAVYATMEQVVAGRFTFDAGIRYEYNAKFGGEWVPQGGVSYRPTDMSAIRFSVAKGYRNPSIRELYVFAPNEDLQPERLMNYELSYRLKSRDNRFNGEVTAYIADAENVIETEFVNGIPKVNTNSGAFTNKGFELAVSYAVTPALRFSANYSYVKLEKPVLAAPRQQVNAQGTYSFGRFGVMLSYQYAEKLYTQVGKTPAANNLSLLNARLNYRPASWLTLYVRGDNLFDSDYQMTYGYPMPGITGTVGVSIAL